MEEPIKSGLFNCPDYCPADFFIPTKVWNRDVGNKYIVDMELVEDLIKTLKEIEDDHKLNRFPKLSRYYNPNFEVVLKMPKTPEEKLESLKLSYALHEANYYRGGDRIMYHLDKMNRIKDEIDKITESLEK